MGISGRIAGFFVGSQLTPLVALVAALLGVFAAVVTPREEEPQINVTMANVLIPFPGASAKDVESLVATPAEQVLGQITGVEHIFSMSKPGLAVLTVQFEVGQNRTDALVRLYDTIMSNRDWVSPNLGVGEPIVKPMGIDDVPIVTLTLWTADPERGAYELERVAHAAEVEIKRVPGTRTVQTVGGPSRSVRVLLDPERMQAYRVTAQDVRQALIAANASMPAGALVGGNRETLVEAGTFFASAGDVARIVVGSYQNRPVFVEDVARVVDGPELAKRYVWHGVKDGGEYPAVTIAVAKKPGENAVDVAARVTRRVDELRGSVIPDGVNVALTRNYGETANDKAHEAHPEARLRDALRGRARVACARAARGGHRRRRGAAHTRRDALRVVGVGLHAQPRVALRAHLLDRHPRRRCDRRRGEHPPPPGARAGGAARAARPARGGRGGRADDPRDVHGHRGAAADGVRHRADGALHEPDPDQRLDRHADLARDRVRRHAVARGEAARWPSRRRGRPRRPRGPESASLLRARDDPVSRRPRGRPQPLEARRGDRRADPRQRVARGGEVGRAEDAAVRQQVGVPGDRRHADRHRARGHDPRAARDRRVPRHRARGQRLPGVRRHRRADQLQRPRAPVLPPRGAGARRPAGEPRRQAPARPQVARDRGVRPARDRGHRAAGTAPR